MVQHGGTAKGPACRLLSAPGRSRCRNIKQYFCFDPPQRWDKPSSREKRPPAALSGVALHAAEDAFFQRRNVRSRVRSPSEIDHSLPILACRELGFRERAYPLFLSRADHNIPQIRKVPASRRFCQRIHQVHTGIPFRFFPVSSRILPFYAFPVNIDNFNYIYCCLSSLLFCFYTERNGTKCRKWDENGGRL